MGKVKCRGSEGQEISEGRAILKSPKMLKEGKGTSMILKSLKMMNEGKETPFRCSLNSSKKVGDGCPEERDKTKMKAKRD